jgi:uncharacterized membrane protein
MSDQFSTSPESGDAVPGYTPPSDPGSSQVPAGGYSEPPAADPYGTPAGAYPPPPPPPPAGGFPPPYAGGYPPADGSQPFALGEALTYGWNKFTQNLGPLLAVFAVAALAPMVIVLVGYAIAGAVGGVTSYDSSGFSTSLGLVGTIISIIFQLAATALSLIISIGLVRATIDITYGRPVTFASVFNFQNIGGPIVAALLVGVGTYVGALLCVLPGLVFSFFALFTLYFAVDKQLGAIDAIKASFELVKNNVVSVLVLYLVGSLLVAAGAALCGIGIFIAGPVVSIALAYGYRKLQGEVVAP